MAWESVDFPPEEPAVIILRKEPEVMQIRLDRLTLCRGCGDLKLMERERSVSGVEATIKSAPRNAECGALKPDPDLEIGCKGDEQKLVSFR